jgi:hypothetical protein
MTDDATTAFQRFEPPGDRTTPWLGLALAATGGLLVAIGTTALGVDWGSGDDDFDQIPGLLLSAVLLAAALGLANRLPGASRAAALGAGAAAVPMLAGFALLGNDDVDYDSFRAFQVITILVWLLLFFVGSLRARAVLLGLALAVAWLFALSEAAGLENGYSPYSGFWFGAPSEVYLDPTFDESSGFDDYPEENDRRLPIAVVSSVFGIAYLAAVRRLDDRDQSAMGTAFAATGGIALATGVASLGAWLESAAAGGVFAVLAGVYCGWAGAGRRRFTTWFGAVFASVGALFIAGDASDTVDGDGSASWFGAVTIVFGLGLVVAATAIARVLREPDAAVTPSSTTER